MPEESKKEKALKTTSSSASTSKGSKLKATKKNKKTYVILVLLIALAGVLYYFRGLFLVAMVNNKPITRASLIKQLEKDAGQATLENLIVKELILQEAQKKGVSVTDEDIQKEIDNITQIIEAQGTTLETALSMQGQTIEDLKDNIRIQKTAEEILKDDISVKEDEILAYFEENKEFYEDREYEDLKEEIGEQLSQEKLQTKFAELLESLKNDSDIIYLKSF